MRLSVSKPLVSLLKRNENALAEITGGLLLDGRLCDETCEDRRDGGFSGEEA